MTISQDTEATMNAGIGREKSESGFTLVEITLAILVVSIGLLAVYGLFPAGLSMSKFAIDDTESALFSEEVLNGLHAKIDGDPAAWANPNSVSLEAVTWGMWQDATLPALVIRPMASQTQVKTNVYVQWDNGLVERSIRYNLTVSNVQGVANIKCACLKVWNGQYGSLNTPAEFYTEFYNYGMVGP